MVPKLTTWGSGKRTRFRAVLFRMVPKQIGVYENYYDCFRAVLFRMVPKHARLLSFYLYCFRAVLFRMVPKQAIC